MGSSIILIKSKGYLERLFHGPYKEAFIRCHLQVDGGSEVAVLIGMADKGFGFVVDSQQFNGDATYQHIKSDRIKNSREIVRHNFWHALGRSKVDGVKLDSFKAVAYILGYSEWRTATYKTLFKVEND